MLSKTLVASAFAISLPFAAQAVVLGPGMDYESAGTSFTPENGQFSELVTAEGDLDVNFSFSMTGPQEDISSFTFGLADSEDFSQANENFSTVSPEGDPQEATGSIRNIRLNDGESLYALIDSDGSLEGNEEADVGFTASATPATVPVPASALLLGGALAGIGVARRRKKS